MAAAPDAAPVGEALTNVAADQARHLLKLHQAQLLFKNRELVELRAQLHRERHAVSADRAAAEQAHASAVRTLQRTQNDQAETLRLQAAENDHMRSTLAQRDDTIAGLKDELAAARSSARAAEARAFDAEATYKAKSEQLVRQHRREALEFQRKLTSAFEQRLQNIKLKHAQEMFLAKKAKAAITGTRPLRP